MLADGNELAIYTSRLALTSDQQGPKQVVATEPTPWQYWGLSDQGNQVGTADEMIFGHLVNALTACYSIQTQNPPYLLPFVDAKGLCGAAERTRLTPDCVRFASQSDGDAHATLLKPIALFTCT